MKCLKCKSERVLFISAKCNDMCCFDVSWLEIEHDGYVPTIQEIGGDDYINMNICMECGQAQGLWPVNDKEIKDAINEVDRQD
jgi:hypothetical protein